MVYAEPVNISGISGMFQYAQDITGIFGIGVLVSLFIVVFGFLKGRGEDTPSALSTAGWITSITSIFLYLAGFVTGWNIFMCFMITILSVLWAYFSKETE